jgi:methionine-rich copper-binding protein CopC
MLGPRIVSLAALLGAAALLAVSVAPPGRALAHARYESSTPGKGEVLQTSPSTVSITFSQDVQKITGTYGIDVTANGMANVTAAPATLSDEDRSIMTVPLQPALAAGRYVVEWTNVSDEDGDPAEGAFAFYVGREPTAPELAADEELAEIGGEEATPTASPGATETEVVGTSVAATPAPTDTDDDDDGDSGAVVFAVVVGAAALVAAGGAGWWFLSRRGR